MCEFFYGWRRKAENAVLVVLSTVCSIATLWAIAFVTTASLFDSDLCIRPTAGRIQVEVWTDRQGQDRAWSNPSEQHPFVSWKRAWPGFRIGVAWQNGSKTGSQEIKVYAISYWMLAIPLTLLSAYLILWKPRKRV